MINFLCKTSWADGVRALAELIQLPDLFKHRYHSYLQTFYTDYQTQLDLVVRRYGSVDQIMLLDFAVMRVIQESDATAYHRRTPRSGAQTRHFRGDSRPRFISSQRQADSGTNAVAGANFGLRECSAATSTASAPNCSIVVTHQ